MTDKDFDHYSADLGLDPVNFDLKQKVVKEDDLAFLRVIYGDNYVKTDPYSRLSVAYGKTMYDLLRLRQKKVENVPDVVVYPDTKEQIEKTVAYCDEHRIPLYVYGGGSSVTRGVECMPFLWRCKESRRNIFATRKDHRVDRANHVFDIRISIIVGPNLFGIIKL